MSFIFQIVDTEKQPVLSVQTTTSVANIPNVVGEVFGRVATHIAASGKEPLGPAFIAYHNMDMENLQMEIGFPIDEEIEGKADIVLSYIPAGKKAVGFHKGSYSELGPFYEKMGSWIAQKGYEPTGVMYEYYYNSPEEIPESELLTKVEFLLK